MYHKNLLESALKDLNVIFDEKNLTYSFIAPLSVTIATPQTDFSFQTKRIAMRKDDQYLYLDFDHEFKFKTQAPFVNFTPSAGKLLVRLSHNKF